MGAASSKSKEEMYAKKLAVKKIMENESVHVYQVKDPKNE